MRPERDPHQTALIDAARRLDIDVEDLAERWGLDAVRYGGRVVVLDGCVVPALSWQADALVADKAATKAILVEAGLPVPPGLIWSGDPEPVQALLAAGPVVAKPLDGTNGEGIALGLQSVDAVAAHAATLRGPVLVESEVAGDDLRLHALGGEVVAACCRVPARVVGDGVRTLGALIEAEKAVVSARNPQNRLVVDEALLRTAGRSMGDVPAAGEPVRLQRLANMALGATAVDVTDRLHPGWRSVVRRAGEALGLDVFALDALGDPEEDPRTSGACILELNARPQWLHHTFSERATHDIGALLLRHLLEGP